RDVDSHQLAQENARVLPVAVRAVLIASAAAVPIADVEHPVGPELQLPAVVVRPGVRNLHQLPASGADARCALARVQLPDDLVARLVREVDVELAVAGEIRRE